MQPRSGFEPSTFFSAETLTTKLHHPPTPTQMCSRLTTVQFLVFLQVLFEVEGLPARGLGAGEAPLMKVLVLHVVLGDETEGKGEGKEQPESQMCSRPARVGRRLD